MAETSPGDARATERLHEYWVHGEGAAKIRWGDGGDYDRCVLHLGKYLSDPHGYCADAHKAATGMWPAQHAAMEKHAGRAAMATTTKAPYGTDVAYGDPGYLDADGNQASKSGKPGVKRYPLSPDKVQAAWSYINQAKNAGQYTPEQLSSIKGKIKSAMAKHGHDVSSDSGDSSASRLEQGPLVFSRDFPLQDISIRAGGDGRTVTAYATVFDTPVPIHDQQGDYIEVIDRNAFDRILPKLQPQGDRKAWRCGVFYNHGMTLHATPSDRNSVPIGVPLEITADSHGLKTVTRYHRGELADQILEAIREGSLSAYSFSGRFDRSQPIVPRGGFRPDRAGNLPTVRRTESTLREYGPTPFPAYHDAVITGVRAEKIAEQLQYITELIRSGAPLDSPQFHGAPADRDSPTDDLLGPEVDLPEGEEHSARYHQHQLYLLRAKEQREAAGLVWLPDRKECGNDRTEGQDRGDGPHQGRAPADGDLGGDHRGERR
jgi:HK97 family phage prohead protease